MGVLILAAVKDRMWANKMKLNPGKMKVILGGRKADSGMGL